MCPDLKSAAAQCQVGESTLRRWQADADFQGEYESTKSEWMEATKNRVRSLALGFVETLENVAGDEKAASGARVSAARTGLELLMRIDETENLQARLEKLEETMKGKF